MANPQGRIEKRRNSGRRAKAARIIGLRPVVEGLENRQLLTVAINEFGGHAAVNMTAGITTGPDGNLWATEADPLGGAIDRITPSGAIQRYTTGLSAGAVPTGITTGPDGALWFTEYGASSLSPFLSGASAIGRIDPTTGTITEFSTGITPSSGPTQIVLGSDNGLWFTEKVGNKIGRIDPVTRRITEFTTGLSPNSQPVGITAGPDKALWFAESNTDLIGRITTAGSITEFGAGVIASNSAPTGITVGPDGALWFTELGSSSNPAGGLGRITVAGAITQFNAGLTPGSGPAGITSGPNGSLYFTEQNSGFIGQVTTQGTITEFKQNSKTSGPAAITLGPDNNLWFTELSGTHVDRITPQGTLSQFPAPDAITQGGGPREMTAGPGRDLYFSEMSGDKIARIDTSGNITEFSQGITPGSGPDGITLGPDGNLWFTEFNGGRVARFNPSTSAITEVPITGASNPLGIVTGSDGNLYFIEQSGQIGRINPTTLAITQFPVAGAVNLQGITAGPDGNLWFTDGGADKIGRLTTQGAITQFPVPTAGGFPEGITSGPDGNLWFTEDFGNKVGRISPTTLAIADFPVPTASSRPVGIAPGPDGSLYFGEFAGNKVGRINTATLVIDEFPIPTASTSPVGITPGPDGNVWFAEFTGNQIGQVVLPQSSVVGGAPVPLTLNVGEAFSGVLATFHDNSPAVSAANFAANVNYGDGQPVVPAVIAPDGTGGFAVGGSQHSYSAPGSYTITVTILNATGQASPITIPAVVSAAAPSFLVTNTNDSGPGSLRQAIQNADLSSGQTITFAIPAPLTSFPVGVATIVPLSPLPPITSRTVIDATSQATFSGRPASTILVQIDGRQTANVSGLIFGTGSAGSILEGVSILNFAGNQVELNADNESVRGCYLGLAADSTSGSASGSASRAGSAGLLVRGANAAIGGLSTTDRDVISGNGYHGILFTGAGATGGLVLGDYIGTNTAGTGPAANAGDGIVAINGAGGLVVKFNLISGNAGNGVELYGSSGNLIAGNLIGTDFIGLNGLGNAGSGICVDAGSSNNTIGGMTFGSNNVISANGATGVAIQSGSSGNLVILNRIGTNCVGEAALGNAQAGILVLDSADNMIGPGNLVSGNGSGKGGAGIWIDGTESHGNHIFGNHVGTNLEGEAAVPNRIVGVLISNASGNTVGGLVGEGNLISGNTSIGLEIAGNQPAGSTVPATANVVQGNVIGLDASGARKLGNGGDQSGVGLYILNAAGNLIGGPSLALGNVISGNNFDGVELFGPATSGNLLQFNRIGTNGLGTGPCGNAVDGLVFDGTSANQAVSNFIDSNGRNGVFIAGSSGVVLQLNQIGLGVGGQALGNGTFGILMGNNSSGTVLLANFNVNNLLGPERNTDISPGSAGSPETNPSVTGHGSGGSGGSGGSAAVRASSGSKHPVKVQPASKSFGGRQVARVKSKAGSRAKH